MPERDTETDLGALVLARITIALFVIHAAVGCCDIARAVVL